ncbi:right-handed parallel beta-helix repeat-containing protein [Lysobacter gummosus]|uniref:Right-handed parallel beta-helix repeat-containing protein n=1 Tax=Lysobacter gummosus TaxID=262324 RepID=A0ABY3XAN1_9GAMM|nr:right-handed parallel beta-helix repeat-containing protein [Lysobacter gummosus]UNP29614.1 right-handed parallel beta-helix repeat-containing protein [Lysobacter gummosus]
MAITPRYPFTRTVLEMARRALPALIVAATAFVPAAHAQTQARYAAEGQAHTGLLWPSAPPAQVCGNTALLTGPATAPAGAVVVPAGDNSGFNFNRPGATFWFETGVHTFGDDLYGQIIARDNATYVGAPGAVLDGRNLNLYAFTGSAQHVTVRYLTIVNFGRGADNNNEGVVNHDAGDHWLIEYNTIQNNDGAGVFLGSDNVVRYNCLKDNGQYGFSMFKPPVEGDSAIKNIVLDHNEIAGNNTDDWETREPGCGCTGGGKFWDVRGARVTNNWVHDNKSVGLWADTNNMDFLFEGNYIADNEDEGIWYEISYNATIRGNTFLRNAWRKGASNGGSPAPAVYLSESGGDDRLPSAVSGAALIRINDNYFEDNFSGVSIYENANRFCNSNGNTSKSYCTPFVSPNQIQGPYDYEYTHPISATHPCYTQVGQEPFFTDCRWHSRNIEVSSNEFYFNPAVVPCGTSGYCGAQALIATGADNLPWSPYTVGAVQDQVMFGANNRFANNHYYGPWKFATRWGDRISFSAWKAAPYNQDVGSTTDQVTNPEQPNPPGNVMDADTSLLEASIGNWSAWYNAEVARVAEQAHGGAYSLRVNVVESNWGVEVANYPGYSTGAGAKHFSAWIKAGAGAPSNVRAVIEWRNGDGSILGSDTVALAVPAQAEGWQKIASTLTAPAATANARILLLGSGTGGASFYLDDVLLENPQN